jgi:hypothetical protein
MEVSRKCGRLSLKRLVPFIVLLFLLLAGLLGTVAYAYFADRLCPLDSGQQALNFWNDRSNGEENQASTRTGNTKGNHERTHNTLVSIYLVATQQDHSESGQETEAKARKSHGWIVKFFCEAKAADAALVFFTYALVVVTGWLAWITLKLAQSADDTAKVQERDTQILQRAYLAVSPQGIHPLSGNTTGLCVAHIRIRNVGRLPAGKVTWFIKNTISDDPNFNEMQMDQSLAAGEITIAPGIDVVQGSGMIFGSDLEKAQASQPSQFCYIWGVVYYLDGFRNVRTTRFCHAYNCANLETLYGDNQDGLRPIMGKTIAADTARHHRYGNDAT